LIQYIKAKIMFALLTQEKPMNLGMIVPLKMTWMNEHGENMLLVLYNISKIRCYYSFISNMHKILFH